VTTLLDLVTDAIPSPDEPAELARYGNDLLERAAAGGLLDASHEADLRSDAQRVTPEFMALAEAAARTEHPFAHLLADIAVDTFTELPPRLAFLETADVALADPIVITSRARALCRKLGDRFDALRSAGDGLGAYNVIETLVRTALVERSCRHGVIDALTAVTAADPEDLLERLPRLVGVAADAWDEPELTQLLELLLDSAPSRVDALFELALTALRAAVAAASASEVIAAMTLARDRFWQVETSEQRQDATIYRCMLDVVLAMATGGQAIQAQNELAAAINARALLTRRSTNRPWLAPRRDAEAQWSVLARTLAAANTQLPRPSWREPALALEAVLEAYRASRTLTVTDGDGVRLVIEPAVEGAFLRREGLLAHLQDLIDAEVLEQDQRESAEQLLAAITRARHGNGPGDALGKALTAAPEFARSVGAADSIEVAQILADAAETNPNILALCERKALELRRQEATGRDPLLDEMLGKVQTALRPCPDFHTDAGSEFTVLLRHILQFMLDRADVTAKTAGDTVSYLRELTAGDRSPGEVCLQRDLRTFLVQGPLRAALHAERHDIAAGRADLTIEGEYRFSVEIKREQSDASRAGLRSEYSGQATAYTVAGPALAVLLVLDLTDHSHGVPGVRESVWVETVTIAGAETRYLVVGVVRGNRPTPSAIAAPTKNGLAASTS
jgi:hypothetical protein